MADSEDLSKPYRIRNGKQAALMYFLDALLLIKPNGDTEAREDKVYGNCVITDLKQTGASELISLFSKNKNSVDFFSNIDTKLLNALLPSVKLYKEFSSYKNVEGTIKRTGINWRIPFDDIPVKFGDSTSEIVASSLDKTYQISNLEDLLRGDGRLNGVGIKSFTYKFVGTNPAETNTNIEAELELYFQNIEDLTRIIKIQKNDERFEVPFTTDFEDILEFSYSDLVSISSTKESDERINPDYFRIKAVVSYAIPDESFLKDLYPDKKEEEIKKIKNFITSSRVYLSLTPFNSDISFEENGSITLKIKYIAALDRALLELDIFKISSTTSTELEKLYGDYYRELKEIRQKIDQIDKSLCSDQIKKDKKSPLEKKLKDLEDQKDFIGDKAYEIYHAFYTNYILTNAYRLVVNSAYVGGDETNAILDEEAARVARQVVLLNSDKYLPKDYSKISTVGISGLPTSTESKDKAFLAADVGKTIADFSLALNNWWEFNKFTTYLNIEDLWEARQKRDADKNYDFKNGYYEIRFVFLGDIINNIMNRMNSEYLLRKNEDIVRLIFGEIGIVLPNRNAVGTREIITNILNIPISIDFLDIFFFDKVVKTRRQKYPLFEFIRDIFNEVILQLISPDVLLVEKNTRDAYKQNTAARLSTTTLSVPIKNPGKYGAIPHDRINGESVVDRFFGGKFKRADASPTAPPTLTSVKSDLLTIDWDSQYYGRGTQFLEYYYIYCSSQLPNYVKNNAGDIDKDFEDRILHFRVGSDSSMIKKITFSRTQNQYYKEARATQSGNPNPTLLQEVYDASITMFGNDIFHPGEIIYIEPIFFTGDKAIEIQTKIGLGGYYVVIDSATSVNENIYETTVNAVLVGHIEYKGNERIIKDVNSGGSTTC